MNPIRIWDEKTGELVGMLEHYGVILWFRPSFEALMHENPTEAGHYEIAFKAIDCGRYLMTHAFLGIPSLPYGSQDKQANEAR